MIEVPPHSSHKNEFETSFKFGNLIGVKKNIAVGRTNCYRKLTSPCGIINGAVRMR